MNKLQIIEAQERVIRELAALNEKLVQALLVLNADVDERLLTEAERLRREAEKVS